MLSSHLFMQSDLLPAHKFDIFVTCHLKPLGVGVGRGGVGHVNVRLHLKLMLRHAWGWVVWGGACQRSFCTCVMKLMLCQAWGWGWVGWGGAC